MHGSVCMHAVSSAMNLQHTCKNENSFTSEWCPKYVYSLQACSYLHQRRRRGRRRCLCTTFASCAKAKVATTIHFNSIVDSGSRMQHSTGGIMKCTHLCSRSASSKNLGDKAGTIYVKFCGCAASFGYVDPRGGMGCQ